MKKIRILQADGDKNFREAVNNYCNRIEDFLYLGGLDTSEDLLETIQKCKANIVLLNLFLKPVGGFPVLKEIRSKWDSTQLSVILFATSSQKESILQKAADLGADYFILRPVDLVVLESRIRQLHGFSLTYPWVNMTLRQVQEVCARYFDLLGIPPHYKGYRYLIEGIWLVCLHPVWLRSVTQQLYPAIGERFGTSGAQVERAMRYALDITWEKGNIDQLYRIFPYEVREDKGKPTNSAFIAKMVDLVSLEIGSVG